MASSSTYFVPLLSQKRQYTMKKSVRQYSEWSATSSILITPLLARDTLHGNIGTWRNTEEGLAQVSNWSLPHLIQATSITLPILLNIKHYDTTSSKQPQSLSRRQSFNHQAAAQQTESLCSWRAQKPFRSFQPWWSCIETFKRVKTESGSKAIKALLPHFIQTIHAKMTNLKFNRNSLLAVLVESEHRHFHESQFLSLHRYLHIQYSHLWSTPHLTLSLSHASFSWLTWSS